MVSGRVVLEACGAVDLRVRAAEYQGALRLSSNVAELTALVMFFGTLLAAGFWSPQAIREAEGLRICADSQLALRVL